MKKYILSLLVIMSFSLKAQDDTLLFNTFNLFDLDTILYEGDTLVYIDIPKSNRANLQLQGWETYSDMQELAEDITNGPKSTNYWLYDSVSWLNWHVDLYTLDSVDTVVVSVDSTRYDTVRDYGLVSYSWLKEKSDLRNVIMSPAVFLTGDVSKLSWESAPIQGPRYQDGYKVYIIEHDDFESLEYIDFNSLDYVFAMKQLDVSNASPPKTATLQELRSDFGFIPQDGTDHDNYVFVDNDDVIPDSTLQQPYMQRFEVDLSEYVDEYIKVVFWHDSYDNYGIVLDNVLITGTGGINVKEVKKGDVSVYPNPASDYISLKMEHFVKDGRVEIFDLNGRLVQQQKISEFELINISDLSPGQYIIKLFSKKSVHTQSFTKIK